MTAIDGFLCQQHLIRIMSCWPLCRLVEDNTEKHTHHLFDYSMLPNVLVLTIRWGDDETHLLNWLTWDATMLKSCCPKSWVWIEAPWVGFMWGMMIFSWESCMLPIMWAQCVFMTTWCHIDHMFVKFSAPMDDCNGHPCILSSVMGMPVGFCHWHPPV